MKLKVVGDPDVSKEEFVKFAFISHADKLGFIIHQIKVRFPDCVAVDTRQGNTYSQIVNIEFEYEAENFLAHGHDSQMLPGQHYIVVCWLDRGKHKLPPNIEVITLSGVIQPINPPIFNFIANQQVYVIPYNSKKNKGTPFTNFKNANIFRTNQKFADNILPEGSIIVIYEENYLVGEFTVEHYEWIDQEPNTKEEKQIYKLLSTVDYLLSNKKDSWAKGHIKYKNLYLYKPKVSFNIGLPKKEMSRGGILKIDFNDLQNIRDKTILV